MGDRASGRNFFQQHSPERAQVVVSLNPGDETRNDRERHRFHDLAEVCGDRFPCSRSSITPHYVAWISQKQQPRSCRHDLAARANIPLSLWAYGSLQRRRARVLGWWKSVIGSLPRPAASTRGGRTKLAPMGGEL